MNIVSCTDYIHARFLQCDVFLLVQTSSLKRLRSTVCSTVTLQMSLCVNRLSHIVHRYGLDL